MDASTFTAINCAMASNSASWGGAVFVGTNASISATATTTLAHCVLSSNAASVDGAALFVQRSGIATLVNSVFQSNPENDPDDGVGIVNKKGQIQCDVTIGCLPVCTACRDEEVPSLPPTWPPTEQVTATPTNATTTSRARERDGWAASPTFVVSALSAMCLFVCIAIAEPLWRFKRGQNADRIEDEHSEGVEVNVLHAPLLESTEHSGANEDAPTTTCSPNQIERAHTGNRVPLLPWSTTESSHTGDRVPLLPWSTIESSPAPIFAIDREMRIASWSQGSIVVHRTSFWL
jgi:hypothetical protein